MELVLLAALSQAPTSAPAAAASAPATSHPAMHPAPSHLLSRSHKHKHPAMGYSTDAPRTCVGSPVRQACVWLMATSHAAPPSRLLTSELPQNVVGGSELALQARDRVQDAPRAPGRGDSSSSSAVPKVRTPSKPRNRQGCMQIHCRPHVRAGRDHRGASSGSQVSASCTANLLVGRRSTAAATSRPV